MATISKRTTKRGDRWDVRVRIAGRVVTKTFATRSEATKWGRLQEADQVRGVAIDPAAGQIKLSDYAVDWIDSRNLAPRTLELYRYQIDRFIGPTFGKASIGKLTPELVRRWNKAMIGTAGASQAAKAYRLLRAMMNTAVSDGLLARNPCCIPGAGNEKATERPLVTPDLVLALADAIAPRFRALVLVAGFGGLRRGELMGLRRRDFDSDAGTLRVERQALTLAHVGRVETAPKTHAGRRTVHLPSSVADELAEHLDRYAGPGPDGFIFTGDNGGPLGPTRFYSAFRRGAKAAGLVGVTPHDLRHAAGTLAAWSGATTRELMARLGHATPDAAMRYQHAASERDSDLAARIDVLIQNTNRQPRASVSALSRDNRAMESEAGARPADQEAV